MEFSNCRVENCVEFGDLAQETSENSVSNQTRDNSCDSLAKTVVAFCPCPKNLPEANVKSFILTLLAEVVSRQPDIDSIM